MLLDESSTGRLADVLVEAGVCLEKSSNIVHGAIIQDSVHDQCYPSD